MVAEPLYVSYLTYTTSSTREHHLHHPAFTIKRLTSTHTYLRYGLQVWKSFIKMSQFSLFNTTERVLLIIHHITALSRPLRSRLLLIWYTIDGQYLDMEAWLRSWWKWALFRVKYRLKFSVRRFSVRRFSLRIFSLRSLRCGAFTAEPSLRTLTADLQRGTFTANSHCGSPARKLSFSASIIMLSQCTVATEAGQSISKF